MKLKWISALLRRRQLLLGTIGGIALTVALLAFLGIFLATSSATLTSRAVADLPLDWQVLVAVGAGPQKVQRAIAAIAPRARIEDVGYAKVSGFAAATGDTVQVTGSGVVLGIGPRYRQLFHKKYDS